MYKQMYFESYDYVINAITERFDQPDYQMYAAMQNIILFAIKGDDFKSEMTRPVLKNGQVSFADLYHDDIDLVSLTTQLELLPSVFKEPFTMHNVFKQAKEMKSSKRSLQSGGYPHKTYHGSTSNKCRERKNLFCHETS